MPSEWARDRAREYLLRKLAGRRGFKIIEDLWNAAEAEAEDEAAGAARGYGDRVVWAEIVDECAAALDAARAEGLQEGRERERWELKEALTLLLAWQGERRLRLKLVGDLEEAIMEALASRGPMRGPEE